MRWSPLLLLALTACPGGGPDRADAPDDPAHESDALPSCAEPRLRVPWTAEGAVPRVPRARSGSPYERRTVHVDAGGEGEVDVTVEGPLTVAAADGTPLDLPLRLSTHDGTLPSTLLVGGTGPGTLRVTPPAEVERCAPVELPFEVVPFADLAVRTLGDFPTVHPVALLRDDETVDLAVDPGLHADRVGLEADVYVVEHKDPASWLADPTLVDVTAAVERIVVGAPVRGGLPIWDADGLAPPGRARGYDVVLDFGRDGRLDPGDLVDGLDGPGFWRAGDLSESGPFTPSTARLAAQGGVELWWPDDLGAAELGPVPLVMIGHGNGHDHRWYGFLGEHLASHGFVVVSHANNTAPGIVTASTSTLQATEWILAHRDTVLDGALAGLVDPHRIAWVGHSRGGEGVVRALQRLAGNAGPKPPPVSYTPHDIRAIVSIAPTVFDGIERSNPGFVPYLAIVGGADGDVTGGVDCPICQSMRIPSAALGVVSILNVHGASHNVFHDGEMLFDDGVGPARLTPEQLHPAERAWLLAWLSWHLLDVDGYADVFGSLPSAFRPRGVPDEVVHTVTLRPAVDTAGAVLDHFQTEPEVDVCSAGGPVVAVGLVDLGEGLLDDRNALFEWRGDAMNGMTLVSGVGLQRGAVLGWIGEASWSASFPEPVDVTPFRTLSLTVARQTRHPDAAPDDLAFAVELVDADGGASLLRVDTFGTIPPPYARAGLGAGVGWANEWQTVRLPLQGFVADGRPLDPRRIVTVSLRFGPDHGAPAGRIGLDDVAFLP